MKLFDRMKKKKKGISINRISIVKMRLFKWTRDKTRKYGITK